LSFEDLVTVLRREEASRLSEGTQAAYARAEASGSDWLNVTMALQERLLSEMGVKPSRMAAALHVLRCAASLFGAAALDQHGALPLYVRHNRASVGQLREGDAVPAGLTVHDLEGQPADFASTLLSGRSAASASSSALPTLVVAGSWS